MRFHPEVGSRPLSVFEGSFEWAAGMSRSSSGRSWRPEGSGSGRFRRETGRRVLRVTVDRDGGVDLDTISGISERLSRRLDLEGFAAGRPTRSR